MKSCQLVIQYRIGPHDKKAFKVFLELEERLTRLLGDAADVDGHDFGSGEANIFVFTPDAQLTFQTIKPTLLASSKEFKAAYRDVDEDGFTALWPVGLEDFTII